MFIFLKVRLLKNNVNTFLASTAANYFGSESILNDNNYKNKIEGEDFVTWCTTSKAEHSKCQQLSRTSQLDKAFYGQDYIEIRCKRVRDNFIMLYCCEHFTNITYQKLILL